LIKETYWKAAWIRRKLSWSKHKRFYSINSLLLLNCVSKAIFFIMQGYLGRVPILAYFGLWSQTNINMIYSDTCLSWTSSRTSFSVRNRQAFGIHRLNSQRFPPLGFYWKFGLYRIPVFSGFGLNGFHCTLVLLQNIPFDSPYHISIFNRFTF
jgi:hypothetical protein